jgi:hypothetical protein
MMKKNIILSIIGLLLFPGCSQIQNKTFDPQKISKYSAEISLATKYTTKFVLKNENLSKNNLSEIKSYLVLAQQTINLDKKVIFEKLNTLIAAKITDKSTMAIAEFIMINIEKYTDSFNIDLTTNQESIRTIVLCALGGALDAVDELLNVS